MTTISGQAPLCACGCGNAVAESKKKPGAWNRFFSHHTGIRPQEQFKKPPPCACGCGQPAHWDRFRKKWMDYAQHPSVLDLRREQGLVYSIHAVAGLLRNRDTGKYGVSTRTVLRRIKEGTVPNPILARVPGRPGLTAVFPKAEIKHLIRARAEWLRRARKKRLTKKKASKR